MPAGSLRSPPRSLAWWRLSWSWKARRAYEEGCRRRRRASPWPSSRAIPPWRRLRGQEAQATPPRGCRRHRRPQMPMLRSRAGSLLSPGRLEMEFLAADTRFAHEAALGHGDYRDPALIIGRRRRPRAPGHGARLSGQGERALLEIRERCRGLEENDLRVGLPPELEADGALGEGRRAGRLAPLEEDARPACATQPRPALHDRGEDCVAGRRIEKADDARIDPLEDRDGFERFPDIHRVLIGRLAGSLAHETQHKDGCDYEDIPDHKSA